MRIFKKIVGWLAILSLITATVILGLTIYAIAYPFFHGAMIYELQPPDPSKILPKIAQTLGDSEQERSILTHFANEQADPLVMYNGLNALEWIADHGRIPRRHDYGNVSAVAVLDPKGKVLAAVPDYLIGKVNPIRVPLQQIQDSTPESPARHHAPFWSSQFANLVRAYQSDVGEVYMNRVLSSDGKAVALLATVGRKHPYVLSGTYDEQRVKDMGMGTIFFYALYWLLVASWVALDAAWRGMRPAAWGVLVLLMNLIGLGGYLIARLPAPGKCPNCGERVLGKYVRCPTCGEPLKANCPICGIRMRPEWQFCPVCVGRSERPADVPTPAPPAPKPAGILGRVLERQSLRPIPDARVFLDSDRLDRSATSDANGCFLLADIPEGPWVIKAEATGFAPDSKLVEISSGRQIPLDLTLSKGD